MKVQMSRLTSPLGISPSDDEQRRLDECAVEPIRTPGSIQPHGALIAVSSETLLAVYASDNCGSILGVDVTDILGSHISAVVGQAWVDENLDALTAARPAANPVSVTIAGQRFEAIIHRVDALTVIEFEVSIVAPEYQSAPSIYNAIHQLTTATTALELRTLTAQELRKLTLFDRVMVYHFHPDGHGEVVAEERADDMEPYLGLHYPASDVPAQARELYLSKLSRMIVSSEGATSTLLSTTPESERAPLDLSLAELRSVSPHHLQFMRNMGQASTLSLSLVRDGKLIGMITLANRTPRRVPYILRQGLEVLANQVALQLSAMLEIKRLTQQMQVRSIRAQLVDQLILRRATDPSTIADALLKGDVTVLDHIPAEGAMVCLQGEISTVGKAPQPEQITAALDLITERYEGRLVSESLANDFADVAARLPGVTGLLVVPLPGNAGNLAWFRPEISEEVTWLGDQTAANRLTPLSPRSSFSSWTQSVSGRSEPWAGLEREADELARDLSGVLLRHAEAQLAALALHDALTGLPNRRLLMDRLKLAVAKHARGTAVTLLFVDLDGFKYVNDSLGHDAGDALLIHVANQISATTRSQDTVARLGGDEFIVLCEDTGTDEAAGIVARIIDAVRQPILVGGTMVTVTASVGIAAARLGQTPDELLRESDAAMYRAKSAGRDQASV